MGCARAATWHAVLFSIPEPGTRIPLQRGPYNGVLRLPLALIVPEMPGTAGAMDQNRAASVRRLPRPWALDWADSARQMCMGLA